MNDQDIADLRARAEQVRADVEAYIARLQSAHEATANSKLRFGPPEDIAEVRRLNKANDALAAENARLTEENARLVSAISRLGGYAMTCRLRNQREWMEGLAEYLTAASKAVGDKDRFVFARDGITIVGKIHP